MTLIIPEILIGINIFISLVTPICLECRKSRCTEIHSRCCGMELDLERDVVQATEVQHELPK